MDSNSLQTRQNLHPNKSRNQYKLTLEARHSISIEASNKIRSSLSPRIFVPRLPISCHSTKSKYFPKELTFKNFKSQNSKNFNISNSNFNKNLENTQKCQNRIRLADADLLQKLKGKYTNKSNLKANSKIMEHKLNGPKRKRNKLEEKKKIVKKLKRRRKMESKEMNLPQNDKNEEIKKCDNFKIIDEANPTDNVTYLTDGDIIFMEDIESMTLNDDKVKNVERIQYKAERNSDQNSRESEILKSSKCLEINNENLVLHLDAHNSLEPSKDFYESNSNSVEGSKKSPVKSYEEFGGKLYQILKENSQQSSIESSSKTSAKQHLGTHKTPKKSEAKQEPNTTLQKSQFNASKNLNSGQLKESPLNIKRTLEKSPKESPQKSPKSRKIFLSQPEIAALDKDSLQNVSFENLLNTVTTSINDFKDFVKSSISQIYDCSSIDQQINEDLINLENNVETFSKYLLKTHKELEEMDRKTANCLVYLNDRYKRNPIICCQNSSSLEPLETDETLTILIEVHKMPIKKITFKKSEILNTKSQQNLVNNKNSAGTIVSQNEQLPNYNPNVKQKFFDTTIISNIKLPSSQVKEKQMQKPKNIRRKITPRKSKEEEIEKYQKLNFWKDNDGQNQDILTTITAPLQNPLRSHRFKKQPELKTSPTSQHDSVLPTNSYKCSQGNCGPQYSPSIPYRYTPQVPNYNTNYTNSNTIYSTPFNPQSQALYFSARNSLQHHGTELYRNIDYQKYPQNPHQSTYYYSYPMTYNSIFVDYLSNQFVVPNEFVNKNSYQESHSSREMQRPND
ncbi:uncharacterized protein ACRADG_003004 [Cochliomyia hominivorax]